MPLPQAQSKIPTAVADINIKLVDYVDPPDQAGSYSVQVISNDDELMRVIAGDLMPHLSAADKTWLSDFLNRMRAKAVAEILP